MPKLYCHFPDASYPTILDTETQCIGYIWKVGRQPQHGDRIGLYFRGGAAQFVSASHAAIRWESLGVLDEDDNELGHWQIMHRSEEHTSELQSQSIISYAVFCLKKKKTTKHHKKKQQHDLK